MQTRLLPFSLRVSDGHKHSHSTASNTVLLAGCRATGLLHSVTAIGVVLFYLPEPKRDSLDKPVA